MQAQTLTNAVACHLFRAEESRLRSEPAIFGRIASTLRQDYLK